MMGYQGETQHQPTSPYLHASTYLVVTYLLRYLLTYVYDLFSHIMGYQGETKHRFINKP
jgi:hypothetical protein